VNSLAVFLLALSCVFLRANTRKDGCDHESLIVVNILLNLRGARSRVCGAAKKRMKLGVFR
jgi:hypothetical protein